MNWPSLPLSKLLVDSSSGTWGEPPEGGALDFPVLRSTNIHDGDLVLEDVAQRSVPERLAKRYRLIDGDIIVTTSSGSRELIGKNALFSQPGDGKCYLFSNFTLRLRPRQDLIIPRFLHLYLNSSAAKSELLRIQSTTSGLRNLPLPLYLSQGIWLPTPSEQGRIVEILDQGHTLRLERSEADRKSGRVLLALFSKMFGDLAASPPSWPLARFGELVDIGTQLVDPNQEAFRDLYHIGGEHIEANTGRIQVYQRVSESKLRSNKFVFDENHVLYSKIRPYLNKVAYPRVSGVCSADIYPLRPKDNRITQWFIVALLRSNMFLSYAAIHSERLRIPKLNQEQLSSFEFPLPDKDLIREFSAAATQLDRTQDCLRLRATKLETLYELLLQRAFAGELTAKWRESHMKELLSEMEDQARALERPFDQNSHGTSTALKRHPGHDMYNKAALAAYITQRCHSDEHAMGRVKLAKLLYLTQKKAELQLTEVYSKRAAGPLDDQIHKFLNLAKKQGWVELGQSQGELKPVRPGKDVAKVQYHIAKLFGQSKDAIDSMLDEMKNWKYSTLERWATILEAALGLRDAGKEVSVGNVKSAILSEKEWANKLDRSEFSDEHIRTTLTGLTKFGLLKSKANQL